jgi:Uma2 family endonuclease
VRRRETIADDFSEPPDIAVEIVSPEQRSSRLVRKCPWYVANGVSLALLVDPEDESVIAFRPNVSPVAWREADAIDLSDILPDFKLTVQGLFATLRIAK